MNKLNQKNVIIFAVGDIMLGDSSIKIGHGVRSNIEKFGIKNLFSEISSIFQNGDIIFGNLEAVLSDNGRTDNIKSRSYRGFPQIITALKFAGFNILNIANNHIKEHGNEAYYETRDLLIKNNIIPLESIPMIFEINGLKIGFLGYTFITEIHSSEQLYCDSNKEIILKDIRKNKKKFDYLILSLHWGAEHINYPSPEQIKIAREFIDSGANIILSHHSHMVQGIERYKNGLINYSLGNFVFDKHQIHFRKTYIFFYRPI